MSRSWICRSGMYAGEDQFGAGEDSLFVFESQQVYGCLVSSKQVITCQAGRVYM